MAAQPLPTSAKMRAITFHRGYCDALPVLFAAGLFLPHRFLPETGSRQPRAAASASRLRCRTGYRSRQRAGSDHHQANRTDRRGISRRRQTVHDEDHAQAWRALLSGGRPGRRQVRAAGKPRLRPARAALGYPQFLKMAVFTSVSEAELTAWLGDYSLGQLLELQAIASGIENTNYFVTTSNGRFVLTLFEKLTTDELPFYLNLMAHLARHGIPCPAPIADLSDQYLQRLNGKPAALVTRLAGKSVEQPGVAECAELGALLARLHLAGRSYPAY